MVAVLFWQTASMAVTYSGNGLARLSVQMGYNSQQAAQGMQFWQNLFGKSMPIWTVVGALLVLGYLVYIRRYFQFKSPAAPASAVAE
jgi:hypothetical protein